jgi:hypothetical protein
VQLYTTAERLQLHEYCSSACMSVTNFQGIMFLFSIWTRELNRSLPNPHEFTYWENLAIATMAVTRNKCIFSHKNHTSSSFYSAWGVLAITCSESKGRESSPLFLLWLYLVSDHEETTDTHSELIGWPERLKEIQLHDSSNVPSVLCG